MNPITNPYDALFPTPDGNGKWNSSPFYDRYVKKSITLIEFMQILQEMFIKFPHTKDYTISNISFGNFATSTSIEFDHRRGIILLS